MNVLEKVNRLGLLMDGAMGSVLIRHGLAGNEAAESWNIRHPEIIKQVHAACVDAGADVVTANTYGASLPKLKKMGAAAVGANCSLGSADMVRLAAQIRASVEIPVIIQPNAGMPRTGAGNQVFYPETDDRFAANMARIRALGIEIIGGCCGTTPDTTRKLKHSVRQHDM